jgi:amino acid adenylation domain-containing protein
MEVNGPMNYLADFSEKLTIAASHKTKEREFWLNQLAGEPVKSIFPADFKREDSTALRRADLDFQLSPAVYSGLTDLCKDSDHALYIILAAGLTLLVHKYTQNTDILIGSPIYQQDTRKDLINTMLVLRNRVEPSMNFKQLVGQMKRNIWAAAENYAYPLELLMQQLGPAVSHGEFPFFDIVILLENIHHKSYIRNISPNVIFSFLRTGERIGAVVEYNSLLYLGETIERIANHFNALMERVLPVPGTAFSGLDILSEEEKRELLEGFNRTDSAYPANKTIHQLFAEVVESHPHRTAVLLARHHMSYCFLNERAHRLSGILREKGVKPGVIVGLMLECSLDMPVAVLGVLKAGGAYLPLETGAPPGRNISILKDCQSPLLLTTGTAIKKYSFSTLQEIDRKKILPHRTSVRPQIRDLDTLPFPNRSLVDYGKYHRYISIAMAKHTISIMGSRGCPYNCVYCHKIWPKNHIVRTAEDVFEEVRMYYNVGIRRFSIIDDIFNLNIKNSARFFQLVLKHGLKVHFFFPNGVRADILTKDYIDLMVEAGTINVLMAFETASPRIQRLVRKNLNIDKFQKNLEYLVNRYPQVIVEMNIMHGFPTETEKEAMMSVDFVKQYKWIHFPNFNILKIFPNTDMEVLAIQHGITKEAIQNSFGKAYHEIPETVPFDKSVTLKCRADLFNNYFLKKERFLDILPHQMKVLSEDELVQKYDSYLPVNITRFYDLLQFVGINWDQLGSRQFLDESTVAVPDFNEKIKPYFPAASQIKGAVDRNLPLRILLIDVSKFFSSHSFDLYDVTEPPLGLMYLLSYLQQEFGEKINGKIIHSRIDFDNYGELKSIIAEFKPEVIGIRSLSYHRDFFHQTISLIRQWGTDVPIIVGGPYATSDSAAVLQDRNIDLLVIGEGEITFARVIEKMIENNGKLPGEEVLEQIPGLAFIPSQERQTSNSAREILLLDQLQDTLSREGANRPGRVEHHTRCSDPAYVMFTSGSTGSPRGILITHANVPRMARDTNYIEVTPRDRLLQLSNYAFDGSVFDIYGALLNGAVLVMMTRDHLLNLDRLFHLLQEENITIFFVTTALFNMLTDLELENVSSIKNILFGGERVSPDHVRKALNRMGKGKILHMYGPTETTVFATYYRINEINEHQETTAIGKPISATSIYILDRHLVPVPRGVTGQICISGTGVSPGYLNRPGLTAKKFIYNLFGKGGKEDRMYLSGDLGRWLPTGHLQFVGRIDHQVKIRGFRIELGEIESQLLTHEEIRETVVMVKTDKRGDKCLCAYVVAHKKLDIPGLRVFLSRKLPDYMIPAYFVPMANIPLTPNGKIDRKALPEPGIKIGQSHISPKNKLEIKLVEIWADVLLLEKEKISIEDNFFELGGHSLNAIVMVARIQRELNVELPLAEVFKAPTIMGLSGGIQGLSGHKFVTIEPAEEKEYYQLSSAQKRQYILKYMDDHGIGYNISFAVILESKVDKLKLERTFKCLIERHESLRTSFHMIADEPVQRVHDVVEFEIEYYGVHEIHEKNNESQITNKGEPAAALISSFIRPFDLSIVPLLRVALIKEAGERHILVLDMHHIISDGLSMEIFVREFAAFYTGKELPVMKLQYKDYAVWHGSPAYRRTLKQQEKYWLTLFETLPPPLELPIDFPRPSVQDFEGNYLEFNLDKTGTRLLKNIARDQGVTLFMLLLALYNVFLSKLSGQGEIVVGIATFGRSRPDLENIIGMFVNTLAFKNRIPPGQTFIQFLAEVKRNTIKAFENQDYLFEDLVEKVLKSRHTNRNSLFDVGFKMDRFQLLPGDFGGLNLKPYPQGASLSKFDMTLSAGETGETLTFGLVYRARLFTETTIKSFAGYFREIILAVVENPGIKLEDIEISLDLSIEKLNVQMDKVDIEF